MQSLVVDKPYKFVPPSHSEWWPRLVSRWGLFVPHLRKKEGVVEHECRHAERLRASIAAGHSVLLTPNHCRTADPVVMGWLGAEAKTNFFAMASWHLFNQGRFVAWAIRSLGAFSVNREGVDRQAINMAVELLVAGRRPLVIFPEGGVSRTNDRLSALLDISPLARTAAKRRAKQSPDGKVVVHPVAIKYLFQGDLKKQADAVLSTIEHRLSWRPQSDLALPDRIVKLGRALLALKEVEHFGAVQAGGMAQRLAGLIDGLLRPLEQEWLGVPQSGPVIPRVKALRIKLLPDIVDGKVDEAERERRWRQLENIALAQQVSCYPPDYLEEYPSVSRLLETIERFEEDLTDKVTVHGSLKAIIEVGEALEVSPERDRNAEVDPLMSRIEDRLQGLLDRLARESPLYVA